MSSLGKGFTWRGLAVRENYAWCHHCGGWRCKEVRGRTKVIIWEVKKQRRRPFLWGLTPLNTM